MAPHKNDSFEANLNDLREAMGVMQHHDAVTGTEKQNVAEDYARILSEALDACDENVREVLNQFTTGRNEERKTEPFKFQFESCRLLNISQCHITEKSENFVVTVYNPLPHSTFQMIRVPVTSEHYYNIDYRGVPTMSQIVPVSSSIAKLNYRVSNASYELVFMANELPPLGYKSFYISRNNSEAMSNNEPIKNADEPSINEIENNEETSIGNKHLRLYFDGNGQVKKIVNGDVESKFQQIFFYYESANGNNAEYKNRSSGAYIFRPNNTEQILSDKVEISVVKGPLVEEVHQVSISFCL